MPISSPSSAPASTRTPEGSTSRSSRPAWGRNVLRVLRVEAHFDRVALWHRLDVDVLTRGHPQLQLDDVEPCELLRDGMLDLDPPVQLEEVDVGTVNEELGRTGAPITDGLGEGNRPGSDSRGCARVETGSGGLLDELLVAPLDRAVAHAEHGHAAAVSEDLRLDVAGTLEESFAEHGAVAERRLGLTLRCRERLVEAGGGADDAHAPAAASGSCFDDQGEADLLGRALGQGGYARLAGDPLRGKLVAASRNVSGGGPTQVIPAATTSSANAALSARKPYPGWIASAPDATAARTCSDPSR